MVYRRSWHAAMATAGLAVSWNGQRILPELKSVRCRASRDVVTVRMVSGQIPDDYSKASLRLAYTFKALGCRVTSGRRADLVVLTLRRRDPLTNTVPTVTPRKAPELLALPVGVTEDGSRLTVRLSGTQILVAGATGAGKGSVLWSLVAALAGGVRAGTVRLWVFDPKGGMEFAAGQRLFDRFLCDDFPAMAAALDQAVTVLRDRAARLRGVTRQHEPSVDDPLYVIVIDELAALTAYLTDRQLKDRIKAALGIILTQGRAVGVHVIAAVQDPRKDVLPFRDLFPTRIALRLTEPTQVDMVLGDGMRDRGAFCDRIPQAQPGVGYLVLDGDPTPARARFSHWTDDAIAGLAGDYTRLPALCDSEPMLTIGSGWRYEHQPDHGADVDRRRRPRYHHPHRPDSRNDRASLATCTRRVSGLVRSRAPVHRPARPPVRATPLDAGRVRHRLRLPRRDPRRHG